MYTEDEMLMLSGIQHFVFCPRQWALIHMEQQWDENRLTTEGQLLHHNVDNPYYRQKNGNVITLRSVQVASPSLGLYGVTDAVELHPSTLENKGITHPKYGGLWQLYPIEYKHGSPKITDCDKLQLMAQAIALEEMYHVEISEGAIFYWEIRQREIVAFDADLRNRTIKVAEMMHQKYESKTNPKAIYSNKCKSCSICGICMPLLETKGTAEKYIKENLYEGIT